VDADERRVEEQQKVSGTEANAREPEGVCLQTHCLIVVGCSVR
jgi:hypothetical protein